jgi:energy-coupling factor transporter ATP-binding protein EcfA2
MKIESVRIQNFRAFKDETIVFDDYTCLVGPNGSGKSTILTALNIFFRDTANASTDLVNLGEEDFHHCNTSQPIQTTVTFVDISDDAEKDLKDYVRQGKLIISAVAEWDDKAKAAPVKQYGGRLAETIAKAKGEKPTKAGGIAAKVEQELQGQMNEMFFAAIRVFVEGLEDVGYISSYLSLLSLWDEFRANGCHLIQVQGKSNFIYAIALANHFNLPSFTVFGADGDTPFDTPEKPTGKRTKHEKDNLAILRLSGVDKPIAFPGDTAWGKNVVNWQTKIGDVVEAEIGAAELHKLKEEVCAKYGIFVPERDKNFLFIGYLMAEAWEQGKKSPTLEKLCRTILEYAKSVDTAGKAQVVEAVAADSVMN